MRSALFLLGFAFVSGNVTANSVLVKLNDDSEVGIQRFLRQNGGELKKVSRASHLFKWTSETRKAPLRDANIAYVSKSHIYHPMLSGVEIHRRSLIDFLKQNPNALPATKEFKDNPEIPNPGIQSSGVDPMLSKEWGVNLVAAPQAWQKTSQGEGIIIAVTDSGVDYTHEDLINAMWRNTKEVAGDGKDNDGNGFVDDIVGYDFAGDDNKPYDMSLSLLEILFSGGNPGHGTHVSGVIGARLNNGKGIAGMAPKCKIMALRFITEKGQGTTEDAIAAIDYAVENGAHIINASWGGEKGEEDDKPLIEAIERAEKAGVIFVAAAGNGRLNQAAGKAVGFDIDNDPKPVYPAAIQLSNILTVAATDSSENMGEFSNWGMTSVKLGAPGVKVLSTVPGNRYQDTIVDMGDMLKATWDGTSMAAPHVSGALGLAWSKHRDMNYKEIIELVLKNVKTTSALTNKVVTGGRLNVKDLRALD